MDATADELAGVVDLFGGLTRPELERALSEAAFRADGQSVDESALETAIDDALESFALVRYERPHQDAQPLLVAGPTAFPSVPTHAEDVPHILDVDPRDPDRDALGETAHKQFVEQLEAAIDAGDDDRIDHLLDVSYDLEAWAPIDLTAERNRLEAAIA
ncbi:DUF7109 family protein [Natronorubrum bangense]|uniref:Uncharacterized protein n=2 Tax=Natronorubrum bangense TaxID=61858 RepID=A0A4D6HH14_9EURY|nr:hypothetical protein [Natronorubrum bangense]ELY43150.1 hypothetical protein C494_19162 [Natronorubrum bangense JCM 10635]QCC53249.1 hypothetical protein DV706_01360 [Natronorubrum bangense]QCC56058.1 hypothetical protein DV706_15910 [Natronorubrum bangense]